MYKRKISRRSFLSISASLVGAGILWYSKPPFYNFIKSYQNSPYTGNMDFKGFDDYIERVILISIDACRRDYFSSIHMPNIYNFAHNYGFIFNNAKTIMTSNTNAAHTSMLTGSYPDKTGVPGNSLYIKEENVYYFILNNPEYLETETLLESIKKHEPSVSTAFISGKWRLPPLLALNKDKEIISDIVLTGPRSGIPLTPKYYKHILGIPETHKEAVGADVRDPWIITAVYEVIRREDPEFVFLNLASTDELQHIYGPYTPRFMTQIHNVDYLLSILINKLNNIGKLSTTLFIITADHGQIAVHNVFPLTNYLKKNGVKADILFEGSSAFIYLDDLKQKGKTLDLLTKLVNKGFLHEVIEKENYDYYHMPKDGRAGDILVSFREGWVPGFWGLTSTTPSKPLMNIRNTISVPGDHGGSIPGEINIPLAFIGPKIKNGFFDGEVSIVDIVPTICDIMKWKLPENVDGRSLAPLISG